MDQFPQYRQIRISDQVADHIVRFIAELELQPGDSLPSESELTRRLGVSRPTVREATNTLAGRGLIEISTGKAPKVLALSKDPFRNLVRHGLVTRQVTMVQVMEVRRSLESQAAAFAAEHRSQAHVADLRKVVDQMPSALGNVEAFAGLDMRFHSVIVMANKNALLASILEGIGDITHDSAKSGLATARNDREWQFILGVHQRIADAIAARKPAEARRHMMSHFDSALQRLMRR